MTDVPADWIESAARALVALDSGLDESFWSAYAPEARAVLDAVAPLIAQQARVEGARAVVEAVEAATYRRNALGWANDAARDALAQIEREGQS